MILTTMFVAVGCSSGGRTQLRVLQASPDETAINVLIDGKTLVGDVGYATPTNYASVSDGSRHLQVEPVGSTTPVIDETVTFNRGTNSTLITANAAVSITPILLTDNTTAPSSGDVQLRFVNAGLAAGDVDIYVVQPGIVPGGVPPTIGSLTFESASGYQSLTAGTYDIFVTIAGTTFAYIDAGPLTFSAGENRTFVVVSDQLGGYSLVTLSDLN
ncbi:MAG TPA: DUF4397 domain-containing protein [Terriglobales bacterium]|nr:DUF4397 domain-containing protein [Terriglobales bacterium]